jgi:hypothetical protein
MAEVFCMGDDAAYYADDAGRNLARKFELQTYDLRSFLKSFENQTGEEAITDGFGILTESEEVTSAYLEFSEEAMRAMTLVHQHLDAIAVALKQVNANTEVNDQEVAALFGESGDGGK